MGQPPAGTLGDLGEFALVQALTSRFAAADDERVLVGPGDDAAVVTVEGAHVVASLDMLVEGRHFRRDWSSATDIGRKAAAENLSDINAMGGRSTALLVGLGAPGDLEARWAMEFADGLAEESAILAATVIGGDLTQADVVTISITALGFCEHGVVRRFGARPGDVVAMAGRQGWASAGYAVLARGFRSPRSVVDAHRRPQPPYDAGPQGAQLGATAMIDVSDGLLQDIGHVATASAVAIDVDSRRFDVPEPLQAVGAALGVDPMRFVLTGGDDYGLVATFPAGTELPQPWRQIGTVHDKGEPGVVTVDGEPYDDPTGHQHFR
ncbi:MAG TPA: thiamine-phosphate kinase [Nocardioidaceae bacterium]|jgi:thiamine-monophosphate kinase